MKYRIAITAMTICSLAAPVLAWEYTTDFRGLEVYDYEAGGIDMQIICDPKGAFIPPIYSARIEFGEEDFEGEAQLKSADAAYSFQIKYGSVLPSDAISWSSLMRGLRSGTQFELIAGDQTFNLDTETPFPVTCGAEI